MTPHFFASEHQHKHGPIPWPLYVLKKDFYLLVFQMFRQAVIHCRDVEGMAQGKRADTGHAIRQQ